MESKIAKGDVGVTLPIKVKDADGNEVEKLYHLSPLTQGDYFEFEEWMQQRYIDSVKRDIQGLNEKIAENILHRAFIRKLEITIVSEEGMKVMNTVEGIKKVIYLSLRKDHPDVTVNEIHTILQNGEMVKLLLDKVGHINGGKYKQVPFVEMGPNKSKGKRGRAKQ